MANSKWEYVRDFEQPDILLPNTWIVVRIDGRGFTKFTAKHGFKKPNDEAGLNLMNAAAQSVMKELSELVLAYGVSDEYSLALSSNGEPGMSFTGAVITTDHDRLVGLTQYCSKLVTTIVSLFSAYYIYHWPTHFPGETITPPLPSFDGRAVCYPSDVNLRDYMSWRQADCHINNLYNTTFWNLVQVGGLDNKQAEAKLSGTMSAEKHEILFSEFGINYNNEPEMFRKGSIVHKSYTPDESKSLAGTGEVGELSKNQLEREKKKRLTAKIVVAHVDLIQDEFWEKRPWILGGVSRYKAEEA